MLNQVPQPAQTLQETQNPILVNFSDIDTAFSVNHVQINDGSGNQGKHNLVNFVVQSSDPAIGGTEVGLYTKLDANSAQNEIYVNKAGANIYPMTELQSGSSSSLGSTRGVTYFPSGVKMRWAQYTTSSTVSTINLNTYPTSWSPGFTTSLLFALITPIGSTTFNYVITQLQFVAGVPTLVVTTSTSPVSFTFVVFGV